VSADADALSIIIIPIYNFPLSKLTMSESPESSPAKMSVDNFIEARRREKSRIMWKLESDALSLVVMMAQESLDPDSYEMFCRVHDRLVLNRHLPNVIFG